MDDAQRLYIKEKKSLLSEPCVLLGVLADKQTAGRGRRKRSWVSTGGGFHGTFVLQLPEDKMRSVAQLSFVTCVAVGDVLKEIKNDLSFFYKWPNDFYLKTGKLGGVLIEVLDESCISIGVGVNLKGFLGAEKIDQKVASLDQEIDLVLTPLDFYDRLLERLQEQLQIWFHNGFEPVRQRWLQRTYSFGTRVKIEGETETFFGAYEGIDSEGFLQLRLDTEELKLIQSGDVSFRVLDED